MAMLLPDDFPLSSLANDAERLVVRALRDGLSDKWILLPDVSLRGNQRDFQLDIVLLHEDFGVVDIEVKGHKPEVVGGIWRSGGIPMQPQPFQQARTNAYELRHQIRDACALPHLNVEYGVAFPNATELTGHLPTDVDRVQILTGADLEDPQEAIERLMMARWANQALPRDTVELIVQYLRPDLDFSWDPLAQATSARTRLDEICEEQIKALVGLDQNRRVAVTGAAGTGKTRLAAAWARNAFQRGERTLFTCYNEPLAAELRRRLPDDELLRIGAFLTLAFELDGMAPLDQPADAGDDWWNVHAVGHLLRHWHEVTGRFDTIIIDEAQDFSPAWIAALESLLDPDGARRVLLVADERQVLYPRGFTAPLPEDGWTRCELVANCRNTYEIAQLLRRKLGGAPAPLNRPGALGVRWVAADDLDATVDAVSVELDRLLGAEPRDPASILVETTSSKAREVLRTQLDLVPWEQRTNDSVVCENVHRAKGLEADTVLFVCPSADVSDTLLYVGISRAISELVVISPAAVAGRLGLS